ncbi:MAG: PilZ domain-containing protein [bacterium]|nr:PilZ domain-containing protein [bacterium]
MNENTNENFIEQRKYPRISLQVNVRLEQGIIDDDIRKYEVIIGKSVNINAGGLLVELNKPLLVTEPVQLLFVLPQKVALFRTEAQILSLEQHDDNLYKARLFFSQTFLQEKVLCYELDLHDNALLAA